MDREDDVPAGSIGRCELCGRHMIDGPSLNKHHLTPKTFGGRDPIWIHRVCHNKIHSVFTERQLLQRFNTIERLLENQEIQKFVKWVSRKPDEFYTRHHSTKSKREKKRR